MNSKRKCKNCGDRVRDYIVINNAAFCSFESAVKYACKNKNKGAKTKNTAQKKSFKDNDKALRLKCAQQAFNAFIRKRDELDGCISCDKTKDWHGQYHAGHFYTTKARGDIRFNEDNCHKQCSVCNNHLSGNIGAYRPRLIDKIGQERFIALSLNRIKRYECAELKKIELMYKQKLKEIKTTQIFLDSS